MCTVIKGILCMLILSSQFCVNNVFFICCRKVEQGQERGVSLDSTSVAQSSQSHFIQSKPDYHGLLCRQQPMLHTMAMIVCWKLDLDNNRINYWLFKQKQKSLRFLFSTLFVYTICVVVYCALLHSLIHSLSCGQYQSWLVRDIVHPLSNNHRWLC